MRHLDIQNASKPHTSKNTDKTMNRYALARDRRITIFALVAEVLSVVSILLILDPLIAQKLDQKSLLTAHLPWGLSLGLILFFQYMLLGVELIVRYREPREQWTIPLAFLPFGHIVRFLFMLTIELTVITIKLSVYFLSVALAFLFLLTRTHNILNSSAIVDWTDRSLEPLELAVTWLYNKLYFNKIRSNTSVFTAFFNQNLSLWCINH